MVGDRFFALCRPIALLLLLLLLLILLLLIIFLRCVVAGLDRRRVPGHLLPHRVGRGHLLRRRQQQLRLRVGRWRLLRRRAQPRLLHKMRLSGPGQVRDAKILFPLPCPAVACRAAPVRRRGVSPRLNLFIPQLRHVPVRGRLPLAHTDPARSGTATLPAASPPWPATATATTATTTAAAIGTTETAVRPPSARRTIIVPNASAWIR